MWTKQTSYQVCGRSIWLTDALRVPHQVWKIHKPRKSSDGDTVATGPRTSTFLSFWVGTVLNMHQSCCLLCTILEKTCILFYFSQDNVGTWKGSNIVVHVLLKQL
jgi:hypothetical protein